MHGKFAATHSRSGSGRARNEGGILRVTTDALGESSAPINIWSVFFLADLTDLAQMAVTLRENQSSMMLGKALVCQYAVFCGPSFNNPVSTSHSKLAFFNPHTHDSGIDMLRNSEWILISESESDICNSELPYSRSRHVTR